MTRFIALLACAAGICVAARFAQAQPVWKQERPVEIIVTCQPGCGPDVAARTLQKIWQDHKIVQAPSVVVQEAVRIFRLNSRRQSVKA